MIPSGTVKFHSLITFITTAMLFGIVEGHFRVGREFPVWNQQQKLPVLRERLNSRISPEWFQRTDLKTIQTTETKDEQIGNSSPVENQVFNDVRPGFLRRIKTSSRKPILAEPLKGPIIRGSEEEAQRGRMNKNRVAPS